MVMIPETEEIAEWFEHDLAVRDKLRGLLGRQHLLPIELASSTLMERHCIYRWICTHPGPRWFGVQFRRIWLLVQEEPLVVNLLLRQMSAKTCHWLALR